MKLRKLLFRAAVFAGMLVCLTCAALAAPSECPYDPHLSIMYNYITDLQRELYDRMYDALWNMEETVSVPEGMTVEEVEWMLDFIYNEAPELCAYSKWETRLRTRSEDGVSVPDMICFAYKMPLEEQHRFIAEVEETASAFAGLSDSEGIRVLHDYLAETYTYGTVDGEDTQLAYYAVKNGVAVCNGYSQMMAMYSHFAGYPCSYIDGHVKDDNGDYTGSHAWNVAEADGTFLWMDVTWDAAETAIHEWYGLDAATMEETHRSDPEYVVLPELSDVFPDGVTCTMHLDINNEEGYVQGVTDKNRQTVNAADLEDGEYYAPALVIWNRSDREITVAVEYSIEGKTTQWRDWTIEPDSNLAFRPQNFGLDDWMGAHEVSWLCNGVQLGVFSWTVR